MELHCLTDDVNVTFKKYGCWNARTKYKDISYLAFSAQKIDVSSLVSKEFDIRQLSQSFSEFLYAFQMSISYFLKPDASAKSTGARNSL